MASRRLPEGNIKLRPTNRFSSIKRGGKRMKSQYLGFKKGGIAG
jgi:hypothetical protein